MQFNFFSFVIKHNIERKVNERLQLFYNIRISLFMLFCLFIGIVGVSLIRAKTHENATFEWHFNFPEDEYVFIEIQKVTITNVVIYGIAFKPRGGKFTIYDTMKGRVDISIPATFGVRIRISNITMMDAGSYRCMVRLQRASYVLQHVIKLVVTGKKYY